MFVILYFDYDYLGSGALPGKTLFEGLLKIIRLMLILGQVRLSKG